MNDDDRLTRYLADQASALTLSPADPAAVVRRGSRRRNRRRAGIAGVAALAVGVASFSVITRDEPDATVDSGLAAAVVASPLDWTVISPEVGLGYSRATTVVDGSIYSLSTAPGPYDGEGSFEPSLYRSDDGAGWSEVSLPTGVRPSSLAAAGGTLYAIGTAPAGGGRDLVVSASTDGAASWSSVTLPAEVAGLEARHPGEIVISQPSVAATDATHLVATVVVTANPDVEALLPGVADPNAGWEITPDGVTVYELAPCEDAKCGADVPVTVVDGEEGAVRRAGDPEPMEPKVRGTYTWDELGLDPELRSLIGGRTHAFAADDGETFEEVTLPGDVSGWGGQVLATDDGYRLFLGGGRDNASTHVLRSADGHTWVEAGTIAGSPQSAGLLGGRPAVAVYGVDGFTGVFVNRSGDSWMPLDLASAVDGANSSEGVGEVAFGPLGVAAVLWTDGSPGGTHIVHSLDGTTVSSISVQDHIAEPGAVMGVSVSADAILIRVDAPNDDNSETVPTQQVLVGTPH
ncbi:MAG: hypothetical protein ACRDZU_00445 [Acidimicrobiales bacterium]